MEKIKHFLYLNKLDITNIQFVFYLGSDHEQPLHIVSLESRSRVVSLNVSTCFIRLDNGCDLSISPVYSYHNLTTAVTVVCQPMKTYTRNYIMHVAITHGTSCGEIVSVYMFKEYASINNVVYRLKPHKFHFILFRRIEV